MIRLPWRTNDRNPPRNGMQVKPAYCTALSVEEGEGGGEGGGEKTGAAGVLCGRLHMPEEKAQNLGTL